MKTPFPLVLFTAALCVLQQSGLYAQFDFTKVADTNTLASQFLGKFVSINGSGSVGPGLGPELVFSATAGPDTNFFPVYHSGLYSYSCVPCGGTETCLPPLFKNIASLATNNFQFGCDTNCCFDSLDYFWVFGRTLILDGQPDPASSNCIVASTGAKGLYRTSTAGGQITKVVDYSDTVPGTSSHFSFLTAAGSGELLTLFFGSYGTNSGLYVADSSSKSITRIADSTTVLPGWGTNTLKSGDIYNAAMDPNTGYVVFSADDGRPIGSHSGIYVAHDGIIQKVVDKTTSPFYYFAGPVYISGNQVLFWVNITNNTFDPNFPRQDAVYGANIDGSGIFKLVDSNNVVAGTTNHLNVIDTTSMAFANNCVIFRGISGSAQNVGFGGLYLAANGVLTKVLAPGDALGGKTVTAVSISGQGINSCGVAALYVTFTNTPAIYLTGITTGSSTNAVLAPGSFAYSASSGFSFTLLGAVGAPYRIQYSTNLASSNWTTISNVNYSAPTRITDAGAIGSRARYYRAVSP